MNKYVAPEFHSKSFNCPHCNAFSHMNWSRLTYWNGSMGGDINSDLKICICSHCSKSSYWFITEANPRAGALNGSMIFPKSSSVPLPNDDMPEDIKLDYLEARDIVNDSPRGASALLRLVIQKLCIHLGEKGKNIDEDIASLVKKGLPLQIQYALDTVRVVGNNSVHPGQLSNDDIKEIAIPLFGLINLIVDQQISQPKKVEELYINTVPEGIRKKRSGSISE